VIRILFILLKYNDKKCSLLSEIQAWR